MLQKRMKMQDLERATGVGRETIRFYIREGLLPQPDRPSRNVAWYDPSFVERLALIKELQQKRFLPLQVIKAIVGNDAEPPRDEVMALLVLDGKLFPAVGGGAEMPAKRLTEVARRTGLKGSEIRQLAATGLVDVETRDGDQWLDDTAIRIVEVWAKMRQAGYTDDLGFNPDNLRIYVDFVRWLAREELRIFSHGVTGRVDVETSVRMAESGVNLMNQMIGIFRKATILRYIAAGNLAEPEATKGPERAAAGSRDD
jgi:predicted DNA-binding transcriptional regulator AlpA